MRSTFLIYLLLAVFLAAATLTTGFPKLSQNFVCDAANFNDTIRIGIPLTMNASSDQVYSASNIRRGLEMVIQWLLYRGEGIKVGNERWGIDLSLVESYAKTQNILNITKSFIDDKSVDVVFAPLGSRGLNAMSSQTEPGNMLLLSPSNDAYSTFMNKNFNYTFRIQPPPGNIFNHLIAFSLNGARSVTYVCGNAVYCNKYSLSMQEQESGNTTSSQREVREILLKKAGLTVDRMLEVDLHGTDPDGVADYVVDTVRALDSDILVLDDWDCSRVLNRLHNAEVYPRGIFLTDCGASVDTSSSQIDFLTTFRAVDFTSTAESPVSKMSPLIFSNIFEDLYRSTPTIEAAYTFAMGEVLVSAIETQASLDSSLCKNASSLAHLMSNSTGFYTILSKSVLRFNNHKIGDENLPLVQRKGGDELIHVDSTSIVYPNPQSIQQEEEIYFILDLLYQKGLAFLPTAIVTFVFMLVVLHIYRLREKLLPEERKLVFQLKFGHVAGFTLRGFGLSSEFFLVVDMLAYGSVRSAMIIVGFRLLHTFLSMWYIYKLFGTKNTLTNSLNNIKKEVFHSSAQPKTHVDRVEEDGGTNNHFSVALLLSKERMLKANKLYSFILFLALFDAQALILLPWRPTEFTAASGGSPNLTMTGRLLTVTVVQSIAVTSIQLMFLRDNYDVHMSPQTRALFILNALVQIMVASVNLFSYFTKLSLLVQKQRALNFSLNNESIINRIAGTKLETIDAYKENPEQFMHNLEAMFNIHKTIDDVGDGDAEETMDDILAYERIYGEKMEGDFESVAKIDRSTLVSMLDIVEEVDMKRNPHKSPVSRRKSRTIITNMLEASGEVGKVSKMKKGGKYHNHKKKHSSRNDKHRKEMSGPKVQASPLHIIQEEGSL